LRCHQVPANVFYSGYPSGTVTNIADGLQDRPGKAATTMTGTNQLTAVAKADILRRGKPYGPPLFDHAVLLAPQSLEAVVDLQDDGQARGVHFLCINASIKSQFEFIQHADTGPRFYRTHGAGSRFVTVRGGAYSYAEPESSALSGRIRLSAGPTRPEHVIIC
jgi:deferrochelatase/peroxidase EfeB